MEEIRKILWVYLSDEEQVYINMYLNNDINIDKLMTYFKPERAKDIADILYVNRIELQTVNKAKELFVAAENYFESSFAAGIILGEGALKPEGMLDLNIKDKYVYESLY